MVHLNRDARGVAFAFRRSYLASMPKKPSNPRPPADENVAAFSVLQRVIARSGDEPTVSAEDAGKNPAAVALGRLGGLTGGKSRAESLTPERRSEIARQGAKKRHGG